MDSYHHLYILPDSYDLQSLGQFLNLQSLPTDVVDFFKERITFSSALCLEEEVNLFRLVVSASQVECCWDIRCGYPGVLDVSLDSLEWTYTHSDHLAYPSPAPQMTIYQPTPSIPLRKYLLLSNISLGDLPISTAQTYHQPHSRAQKQND